VGDREVAIAAEHVTTAKEILIQRQETHLDSLVGLLREPKVQAVFEPMLAGQELGDVPEDDRQYLCDLGLLRRDPAGRLVVANRIYQEVIPRVLANGPHNSLPTISPSWLTPEGTLDPEKLLEALLRFWRQHGQPLLQSAPYHEIAPHLVLMAFLHRVVNGGDHGARVRYWDISDGSLFAVWESDHGDGVEGLAAGTARSAADRIGTDRSLSGGVGIRIWVGGYL